jgi:hypothetical protein
MNMGMEGFNFNKTPVSKLEQKPKSFEEQWQKPKHVKVLGSSVPGSTIIDRLSKVADVIAPGLQNKNPVEGLHGEYFDVYDISPEKSKTEVPVVLGYGWGAKAESEKEIAKNIVGGEAGSERRVIVSDTPHGISAEKKKIYQR